MPEGETPQEPMDSSLVEVLREGPVVQFLSTSERERDEEDLSRLEEGRVQRERDTEDVTDLEPLPSHDVKAGGGTEGLGNGSRTVLLNRCLDDRCG